MGAVMPAALQGALPLTASKRQARHLINKSCAFTRVEKVIFSVDKGFQKRFNNEAGEDLIHKEGTP
jgi:hypothetical protein